MKILLIAFACLLLSTSAAIAQSSRVLYVGDTELRLGTERDVVMKNLTAKYNVLVMGASGFVIRQYDQRAKTYKILGTIGFDNNQLSSITREINTSEWPDNEGFAVARAIYDGVDSSIPLTDSDGAKRANAIIVTSSQDTTHPTRGNFKHISIFINNRSVVVTIWDSTNGKAVSASVSIRTKPW